RRSSIRTKLRFLPDKMLAGEEHSKKVVNSNFDASILDELTERRRNHVNYIKSIRPSSVHEWFYIYPGTVRAHIPNHYCNRRLFANYEIFMSHEAVKIGSGVPTEWKLNRRLFHTAFQSCLAKS